MTMTEDVPEETAADMAVEVSNNNSNSMQELKKRVVHHFSNPLGETFPLVTRPVQRQRWGDTQIHPVVNWGDLFFDLFYVGAAYNLGYIILNDPTNEGLLYFFGAFLPIMQTWMDKTFYDARYFTKDDLFHRAFEIATLCALATAVVHIRPVDILSRPADNVDMFALSLGLLIGTVFSMCRHVEVMLWVDGGPEAKINARRDVVGKLLNFVFYLAATIYAGNEFFGDNDNEKDAGKNATEDGRMLAGDDEKVEYDGDTSNVPIWLLLAGGLSWAAYFVVMVIFLLPGGGKHKSVVVPANISFTIHRYGEWIMLMLGESILSLLIVDVLEPSGEYYLTFYAGILSVVFLQYLHFRSQPHDPDDHAMRKSKEQGIIFSVLITIYSAALVLIGTAYKMLVNEHAFEDAKEESSSRMLLFNPYRMLAGGDDSGLSTEDRQQRVANLFCGSMAVVWLTNDLMMINHNGLKDNMGRCVCKESKKFSIPGVALISCRVGLIVFIATLRGYVTDPTALALIGLAGIVAQVALRVIGALVFPSDRVHAHVDTQGLQVPPPDVENRKWPNVTHAQAQPSEVMEE